MEVFEAEDGAIAVVQASGPEYPHVLTEALRYPDTDDAQADQLVVAGGELALFSTAGDGVGPHAAVLVRARPGPVPPMNARPSAQPDPGLPLTTKHTMFNLKSADTHNWTKRTASPGGCSCRHELGQPR
jgi:hypothetical protein